MKINFLSNLFKKDTKQKLITPDSILVKKIKSVCEQNNLKVLQNTTIYHHDKSIVVSLMILDPNRGLFILEYKDWTYDDLQNYELKQSRNNRHSKNTLAFDKVESFINTKFNEILHNDCVKFFNFLVAENLSFEDYKHLSDEKKSLLPYSKVIFCDNDENEILKKLKATSEIDKSLDEPDFILANMLTQYLVFSKTGISLATNEQIAFIEDSHNYHKSSNIVSLNGLALSGKTTSLVLKAVYLKLLSQNNTVTIIEPTTLSCDIVKKYILELIEHTIVSVDITSINVYTPEEFLNSKATKYVLCDDTSLIEDSLLKKIRSKSSKSYLTLVNPLDRYEHFYKLTDSFHDDIDIEFVQNDPYPTAMQKINSYSNKDDKTILCVSNLDSSEERKNDISSYISKKATILDGSKKLVDQERTSITLSDYKNINAQRSDIVVLLDICEVSQAELSYAINLADEKVFLIYEDECEAISTLKKIFKKDK